ncbi:hypothetical protein [Calothrix sp. PCC 6303]|uniref:hypothetical protein n=1 Tax=Calothrix sp. PCC 6303 TaxID=1170562 RepID=UPI0002A04EAB|nr:hypothetical protein [Calothrix sp. PCC 6303]AFZ00604.1 hypothetical protein Cal6303_1559 [Calothrix sp. PCC 6303]
MSLFCDGDAFPEVVVYGDNGFLIMRSHLLSWHHFTMFKSLLPKILLWILGIKISVVAEEHQYILALYLNFKQI